MPPQNPHITDYSMVKDMYEDGWFPNHLVDKIKQILLKMCDFIEEKEPTTTEALFSITHEAVEKINDLEEELYKKLSTRDHFVL